MFDAEFLKDRYAFELDRKDKLTDALGLPVGILTILGGAMAAMARSFGYSAPITTSLFLGFLLAGGLSFVGCAFQLARAYLAQTYVYLPLLGDLERWEVEDREWRGYVRETGGETDEDDFDTWLRKRIISAADANTKSNDARSKWLHRSRIALLAVFCFTALAGIPYVADQVRVRNADTTSSGASEATNSASAAPSETGVPGEQGDQGRAR